MWKRVKRGVGGGAAKREIKRKRKTKPRTGYYSYTIPYHRHVGNDGAWNHPIEQKTFFNGNFYRPDRFFECATPSEMIMKKIPLFRIFCTLRSMTRLFKSPFPFTIRRKWNRNSILRRQHFEVAFHDQLFFFFLSFCSFSRVWSQDSKSEPMWKSFAPRSQISTSKSTGGQYDVISSNLFPPYSTKKMKKNKNNKMNL